MKKRLVILAAILVIVLAAGGVLASEYLTRSLTGEMKYVQLEGGFWAVVSDGENYIPINLSDDYTIEGLKVRFKVVERPDIMGIHMNGTYVEILE